MTATKTNNNKRFLSFRSSKIPPQAGIMCLFFKFDKKMRF